MEMLRGAQRRLAACDEETEAAKRIHDSIRRGVPAKNWEANLPAARCTPAGSRRVGLARSVATIFEQKSLAEVGAVLGTNDGTATESAFSAPWKSSLRGFFPGAAPCLPPMREGGPGEPVAVLINGAPSRERRPPLHHCPHSINSKLMAWKKLKSAVAVLASECCSRREPQPLPSKLCRNIGTYDWQVLFNSQSSSAHPQGQDFDCKIPQRGGWDDETIRWMGLADQSIDSLQRL